jgi:hypothetical protein
MHRADLTCIKPTTAKEINSLIGTVFLSIDGMKCDISMFREQAFPCPVPVAVQALFMNVLYFCRIVFTPCSLRISSSFMMRVGSRRAKEI